MNKKQTLANLLNWLSTAKIMKWPAFLQCVVLTQFVPNTFLLQAGSSIVNRCDFPLLLIYFIIPHSRPASSIVSPASPPQSSEAGSAHSPPPHTAPGSPTFGSGNNPEAYWIHAGGAGSALMIYSHCDPEEIIDESTSRENNYQRALGPRLHFNKLIMELKKEPQFFKSRTCCYAFSVALLNFFLFYPSSETITYLLYTSYDQADTTLIDITQLSATFMVGVGCVLGCFFVSSFSPPDPSRSTTLSNALSWGLLVLQLSLFSPNRQRNLPYHNQKYSCSDSRPLQLSDSLFQQGSIIQFTRYLHQLSVAGLFPLQY